MIDQDVKDDASDQKEKTEFHYEMEKRSYIYIYKGSPSETVNKTSNMSLFLKVQFLLTT